MFNFCKGAILYFLLLFVFDVEVYSQRIVNHEYPRLATLNWGRGNVDWLSRFDLILGVDGDSLLYRAVKIANPDGYILTTTDWNAGGPFRIYGNLDAIPPEWRVRRSNGSYIKVYSSDYFVDPTEYCGLYDGERYNQALPRRLMERTDWNIFDGVSSDGSWPFPYNTGGDIDLDRNGVNDYTEHGSDWIERKWQAGQNAMRNNLRDRFKVKWGNPNEKMIFYWTITDTMCIRVANGGGWENMYINSPEKFSDWIPLINQWDSIGVTPRINLISADIVYDSVNAPDRHKDYYRFLRWTLTTALLNNVYFMSGDIADHHWSNYYDEYDVKLGHPKGRAQKLSNGCWVRFFDNGVSIVNPTNTTQTVTSSNLSSLSGYDGPYYRFKGNQDPVWNDGSSFTSVTMIATKASYSGSTQYVGDGIILVKTPTTIVSDIIIDNSYSGTSPGSPSASLTGFSWDRSAEYNDDHPRWFTSTQISYANSNYYDSYYAAAGTGSAKAIFKPTINISGQYLVYEWHGWRVQYSSTYKEASNVPCTILHSHGTTNVYYDQTKNYGKWNLLGKFDFTPSANNSATITNNANGYVIADVFKFEYVDATGSPPPVPQQNSPSNGAIDQPTTLNVIWNSVIGSQRYHLQVASDSIFQSVILNDSMITDTIRIVDNLSNGTKYYWRVRSINEYGSSSWSTVWNFRTINTYFIQGKALFDRNNNAVRDPEDPDDVGIPGWKIYIQGNVNDSVRTDKDGSFIFENLPAGNYIISDYIPPEWARRFPSYPLYLITLSPSRTSANCNFGYYAPNVVPCNVKDGWNLVSLPLEVSSVKKTDVFPTSVSRAFYYQGFLAIADNLEFGRGYWLSFAETQTLWIAGSPVLVDTINVSSGWNLIGTVSDSFPLALLGADPDDIVSSFVYGYNRGYTIVDTLIPGSGYWIQTSQSGKLIFSHSGQMLSKTINDVGGFKQFNSLSFSSNGLVDQKIFFTTNSAYSRLNSQAELPPAMEGIFDVRFFNDQNSGFLAAYIDTTNILKHDLPIILRSVNYPLTIKWQINDENENYGFETNRG
ncbi:MAG: hypothetical protein HY800_06440, partial [Ignavibacteriales bacterium]|nr:hypothetical protein [Ignavibacteriales bacterium]